MAINKLTQCYELYREQIQHEDMLLNQRVTWIRCNTYRPP